LGTSLDKLRELRKKLEEDVRKLKEELKKHEDDILSAVLRELRSTVDELASELRNLITVTVMVDVVPTEYAVMDYDMETSSRVEKRKPRSVEAYKVLSRAKNNWIQVRERFVLIELFPGVYVVDPQQREEIEREWKRIIETALRRVEAMGILVRHKARLEFVTVMVARHYLIQRIYETIAEYKERMQKLREALDYVKPSTKVKYLKIITELQRRIEMLQRLAIERLGG